MGEEKDLSIERPSWPSVEAQLTRAKVPPGSALEQLIRDNQDFEMLLPEEAHDRLEYPPWLRVYWRKLHPTSRHAPGDPSGGYPMALDKVLHWMLSHPDNPAGEKNSPEQPLTPPANDAGQK